MVSKPISKLGVYSPDEFANIIADKSFIKFIPDAEIHRLSTKEILENYPFHDVTENQFIDLVSRPESTLKIQPLKLERYNINRSRDPLDHWVAESLKLFDRDLYDSMKGYSKIARPSRAYASLLQFSLPIHTSTTINSNLRYKQAYHRALGDLDKLFKDKKFDLLPQNEYLKQIPQNTAAGYPFFGFKKGEVWSLVHRKTIANFNDLCDGKKIPQLPCTLALRGHLSPITENKTRPIWLVPFETIALENIMFRNMYDFIFTDEDFSDLILTGKDTLGRLRDYLAKDSPLSFINLDYSKYDSYRCRFACIDVFNVLKKHINMTKDESNVFYYIRKQFIDSQLLLPNGTVIQKQSGTPSGSLLTAMVNSLMNFVMLKTCFYLLEVDLNIEDLRILGDDASFYYGGGQYRPLYFVQKLTVLLKDLFGIIIKPEKGLIVPPGSPIEHKKFIGYSLVGNQLFRPEEEFFLSVLYPESDVRNVVVSFSRVFSYFMLGGIFHNYYSRWFKSYLGHYWHLLSKEERILNDEVFRMGNLRVIKHVFQIEVDELIKDLDVHKFMNMDFMQLPYFLTLRIPLRSII